MAMIQTVRCPNCGSLAERYHHALLAQVKTQCDACDYLMVTCTRSSRVIESYAPGLPSDYACNKKTVAIAFHRITEIYQEKVASASETVKMEALKMV
jgi:hypothetical protein